MLESESGVVQLRDDVDLAIDLTDPIGAKWGVSRTALSSAGRGIKIREVTTTNKFSFLRAH